MTEPEYTGKDVSYYLVDIKTPKRLDPYKAECEDIIEALGMTFAEGCAFKAIWRKCAARTLGVAKAGYKGGLYDAEKTHYYGGRMVAAEERLLLPQHAPVTFKDCCAEIDAEIQAAALAQPMDIYAQAAAHMAETSPQPRVVGMNPNLAAPFHPVHPDAAVPVCPSCGREEGKKHRRGCPTLTAQPEAAEDPFAGAPDWAKYKAQDSGGKWWWYSDKPKHNRHQDFWLRGDAAEDSSEFASQGDFNTNWRDTLIERPTK